MPPIDNQDTSIERKKIPRPGKPLPPTARRIARPKKERDNSEGERNHNGRDLRAIAKYRKEKRNDSLSSSESLHLFEGENKINDDNIYKISIDRRSKRNDSITSEGSLSFCSEDSCDLSLDSVRSDANSVEDISNSVVPVSCEATIYDDRPLSPSLPIGNEEISKRRNSKRRESSHLRHESKSDDDEFDDMEQSLQKLNVVSRTNGTRDNKEEKIVHRGKLKKTYQNKKELGLTGRKNFENCEEIDESKDERESQYKNDRIIRERERETVKIDISKHDLKFLTNSQISLIQRFNKIGNIYTAALPSECIRIAFARYYSGNINQSHNNNNKFSSFKYPYGHYSIGSSKAEVDMMQCLIVRDKKTIGHATPVYRCFAQPTGDLLMIAIKKKSNSSTDNGIGVKSSFHFFDMTRGSPVEDRYLSRKAGNYIGRFERKQRGLDVLLSNDKVERQLACFHSVDVTLLEQILGDKKLRRTSVILPPYDPVSRFAISPLWINGNKASNRDEEFKSDDMVSLSDMLLQKDDKNNEYNLFVNKEPVLDRGTYRLNFRGRVKYPSVKNFQLILRKNASEREEKHRDSKTVQKAEFSSDIVFQFGKIDDDMFNLDFKEPFNTFQAFAAALTQF